MILIYTKLLIGINRILKKMKVVILAGGKGLRFFEEVKNIPKPMIRIGNKPILWHIMKIYSYYWIIDFIISAGYKNEIIKEKNYLIFFLFLK